MTSSPGLIELSDPPEVLSDPFNSFPFSDLIIILRDIDVEVSSPTLLYTSTANTTAIHNTALPSSDFLEIPHPSVEFSTVTPRLIQLIRKRGLSPLPSLN